jgi:hypothetical protein
MASVFMSSPYWLVSSAIRFSSTTPLSTRRFASSSRGAQGLLRNFPLPCPNQINRTRLQHQTHSKLAHAAWTKTCLLMALVIRIHNLCSLFQMDLTAIRVLHAKQMGQGSDRHGRRNRITTWHSTCKLKRVMAHLKPGMAQNVHAWLQPSATRRYAV